MFDFIKSQIHIFFVHAPKTIVYDAFDIFSGKAVVDYFGDVFLFGLFYISVYVVFD